MGLWALQTWSLHRRTRIARSNCFFYATGLTLSWLLLGSILCNTAVLCWTLIAGSLLPRHLHTLFPLSFLWRKSKCYGCILIEKQKNKISLGGEKMPCVLSWRLSDWLHLLLSNLALSSSRYDKLSPEPIFRATPMISLALSQLSPAELLDRWIAFVLHVVRPKSASWCLEAFASWWTKELSAPAGSCYPSPSAWCSCLLGSVCRVSRKHEVPFINPLSTIIIALFSNSQQAEVFL